jgi:hypothetical protein
MSRGRKPIPVDKDILQNVISVVESSGEGFASRSQLWKAVADTEWAKRIKLSPQVAMLKANTFGLQIKTPKGKKGRSPGSGPVPNAGKRTSKRIPLDVVAEMKKEFVSSLHGKIDRAAMGSMKAAIALKCIECSGGYKKEVSLCRLRTCPLWVFRPYQNSYAEDDSCGK